MRSGLLLLVLTLLTPPAWAEGPDETTQERRARKKAERLERATAPDRLEWLVVPEFSYDTDVGVGTGVLGQWAKLDPNVDPYKWRLSAQAFFSFRADPAGGLQITLQHHYLTFDVPGLFNDRLRLTFSFRFRRESTHGYYGLGNGSLAEKPWLDIDRDAEPEAYAAARRYHMVDRTYPVFFIKPRFRMTETLSLFGEIGGLFNKYTPYVGSRLEEDLRGGDPVMLSHYRGLAPHGQILGGIGILADTRDDETAPESGHLTEGSVRWGKGIGEEFEYAGFNVTARGYIPLKKDHLTLGFRGLFDGLVGNPPMYELVRAGGLLPVRQATGGAFSFRGVPAHRYYGKIKIVANLELRMQFFTLKIFGRALRVGAIAFVDTGRVWADWRGTQRFDETPGNPLGLKLGAGGGLRLRLGETIMVRIDGAGSPDGWGLYVDVDHIF
jgi:hypothetical protein